MRGAPDTGEHGHTTLFVALLVVVVIIAGAAVAGLYRTASLATDIDRSSRSIARGGGGINTSTRAIVKLDRTNELGDSIEATADQLQGKLAKVIDVAHSIDATASSVTGTARAINASAKGINATAASILGVGRSINDGVEKINLNVVKTIELVRQVQADTANIAAQAALAHKLLSCIDSGLSMNGVNSTASPDGHCR